MNSISYLSHSEAETFAIGKKLGVLIDNSCLIFLKGTLGAGKTRLVQALGAGLDIDPKNVTSPTFTIMVPHPGRLQLVHVDAYRINDCDEAEQLGLEDWLNAGCVMAVEWADRIASALPAADLLIEIEHAGEHDRTLEFIPKSDLGNRLIQSLSQVMDDCD